MQCQGPTVCGVTRPSWAESDSVTLNIKSRQTPVYLLPTRCTKWCSCAVLASQTKATFIFHKQPLNSTVHSRFRRWSVLMETKVFHVPGVSSKQTMLPQFQLHIHPRVAPVVLCILCRCFDHDTDYGYSSLSVHVHPQLSRLCCTLPVSPIRRLWWFSILLFLTMMPETSIRVNFVYFQLQHWYWL